MDEEINEGLGEDVLYDDIENKYDIVDISSSEENDDENSIEDSKDPEQIELIKFKEKNISYYKKFYGNKSLYCVNSYKKWIYFGSINNKCYLYNSFDSDLKCFANGIGYSNQNGIKSTEIELESLKNQKYRDTVTNIKISKDCKYVAFSIYNGDIYVYENNNMNSSELLNYNLNNIKKNINNSNSLVNIYNWDIGQNVTKEELINEDMKFINILSINSSEDKKDIEYFMFCPYNENIIISIYLNSPNIYIWDIFENTPINIAHTIDVPTFINICNYGNNFYLISGFDNGTTNVYDYNIYNLKKKENTNKKFEKREKKCYQSMGSSQPRLVKEIFDESNDTNNETVPNTHNILNNVFDENCSNDILCIDNCITNEIYLATHKNIIKLYNINTNSVVSIYDNMHTDLVDYCLFNNKKNNLFASSSLDNNIIIYDFQNNKCINTFCANYDFNIADTNNKMEKGINFLKWINSNLLLFSSLNGNIYIYDIRTRKCVHQFYCHTDTIFNINLSLHLYQNKNILSILTASDDNSSTMHFFDMSMFI
ncbi:WD repeat-containing protein, putative [Plasmodium vinckei brucechwatti]|uniref:WD repeat-containing protein, putative n=1 Tax=Plasmodium vinckei brucechwatti TaxID=119398 RepID=A0A6V7RX71_PLAVN|nr:WD repeat-containing protein, putative [Plasmodium vinckei brucechwatti]